MSVLLSVRSHESWFKSLPTSNSDSSFLNHLAYPSFPTCHYLLCKKQWFMSHPTSNPHSQFLNYHAYPSVPHSHYSLSVRCHDSWVILPLIFLAECFDQSLKGSSWSAWPSLSLPRCSHDISHFLAPHQAFRRTALEGGLVQKATEDQYIEPSPAFVPLPAIEPSPAIDSGRRPRLLWHNITQSG